MTVHLANLYAAPVEIVESEFPCRIRRFELNPDSGGAGEFRGGLNFRRVYEMLEPAELVYRSDRAAVPPAGLRGGRPGGPSRFILHPDTEDAETMPSSCRLSLDAGTVFSVQGAGGGGYGEPARRAAKTLRKGMARPPGLRDRSGRDRRLSRARSTPDGCGQPPFPAGGRDTPVSRKRSLSPRNDPKNSPSLPSLSWK